MRRAERHDPASALRVPVQQCAVCPGEGVVEVKGQWLCSGCFLRWSIVLAPPAVLTPVPMPRSRRQRLRAADPNWPGDLGSLSSELDALLDRITRIAEDAGVTFDADDTGAIVAPATR